MNIQKLIPYYNYIYIYIIIICYIMLHYDYANIGLHTDIEKINCVICNYHIFPEYTYRYIYCLKCIKNITKCSMISCHNYFLKNKQNYCYQCECTEKIKLIQNTHNIITQTLPVEIIQMITDFL